MNNNITSSKKLSSVQDGLRSLQVVVKSMEDAGITVLTARAEDKNRAEILFTDDYALFNRWATGLHLTVRIDRIGGVFHDWRISTNYNGVEISSYMKDRDKEVYDREITNAAKEA